MKKLLTLCLALALCVSVGAAVLTQSPAKKVSANENQPAIGSLTVAATEASYAYNSDTPDTHHNLTSNPASVTMRNLKATYGMSLFSDKINNNRNVVYTLAEPVDASKYECMYFKALYWANKANKYFATPFGNLDGTAQADAYIYGVQAKDMNPYIFWTSVPTSVLKNENGMIEGFTMTAPEFTAEMQMGWFMISEFTFSNEIKIDLSTDKTNLVTNGTPNGLIQNFGTGKPWADLNLRNSFQGGGVGSSYVATFGFEKAISADSVDYFKFRVLGWSSEGYRLVTVKNLDGTEVRAVTVAYAYGTYKTYDIEVIIPAAGLENADGMIEGFIMECATGIDYFAFSDITYCKGTPDYSIDVLKSSSEAGVFQRKNWANIASWEELGLIYNGANLENKTITVKFKMPVDANVYKTIDFKALVWLRGGRMKAEVVSLKGNRTELINLVSAGNNTEAREANLDVKINAQLLADENGMVEGFSFRIVDDNKNGHLVFSEMHGGTEEKQYNVIYKAEGSEDIVKTYTSNSAYEEPAVPAREHYENGRWNKALDDIIHTYSDTPEVVTALYDAIEYTVTFKAEGAEDIVMTYTVENVAEFTAPDVPEKAHYTGAWEAYTLNYDNAQVVNATYTAIEYTVTFKAEGAADIVVKYTVENKDSFAAPAVPAREHFENGAWEAYTLNYDNTQVVNATYTAIVYTVTFKAEGAEDIVKTYTAENVDEFTAPAVPEKAHYTGTWEAYSLNYDSTQVVNATYTAIEYTVTFKAEGAEDIVVKYTVENKDSFAAPAVPAREHFENGAWEAYTLNYDNTQVVNATYTAIEYTVTFKAEGAEDIVVKYTAENVDEFKKPAVPEKAHYTGAWETYTLNYDNAQVVNATYTAIEYTVTFKAEGAEDIVVKYTVENKDSFAAPAVPAKEGFEGKWAEYELNFENITVQAVYTEILDGCKSSVTGTMVPLFALLGVALVFKRKKQD